MKTLFYILSLFSFSLAFSQTYNFEQEFRRIVDVPNSPEAEAFEKYGNTPVNLYTGTPSISVPIYTIKGKEIDLPISLSYDASGVKVQQLATNVGLGWNLNAGGRISRIKNGLVDDYNSVSNNPYQTVLDNGTINNSIITSNMTVKQLIDYNLNPPSSFNTQADAVNYFKYLKAIGDNYIDVLPDYFSFYALGVSDQFVYDLDTSTFVALDNPRIKAVPFLSASKSILYWTITLDDGTKLYFNQAEKTRIEDQGEGSLGAVVQEYNSSWVLTKIESPNLQDVYEFEYSSFNNEFIENEPRVISQSITNELSNNDVNLDAHLFTSNIVNKTKPLALVRIKHNYKTLIDITLKSRSDFNLASAIDKIDIKDPFGVLIKRYQLNHSYFGSGTQTYEKRLKLDNIQIKSANNVLSSYSFEYNSPSSVPSLYSKSIDFLGYYNGKYNTVLYPSYSGGTFTLSGADRSPDFTYAQIGLLSKITYPTGGYSEFTYEPNSSTYTNEDITASTQDITYSTLSVTGGIGSSSTCGACCIDQYGNPPNVSSVIFTINESGQYIVDFDNQGAGYTEAYVFKRGSQIKPGIATLAYDEIIDQSNCLELVNMSWTNFNNSQDSSVYLSSGTYQMTLAKGYSNYTPNNISLRIHREEITNNSTVGTGEVARAGIRIKSIKDYSDTNVLSTEKEYIYKTSINGTDSSGEILFKPSFYEISQYETVSQVNDPARKIDIGWNTRVQLRRNDSWSGGDRPHVAYSKVFEKQKSSTDDIGYIEHQFNADPYVGVYSSGVNPNVNLYSKNYSSGKESKSTVYSNNNEIKSESETVYYDKQYFGNSTFYVYSNPLKNYKYVNIFQGSDNKYYYNFLHAVLISFNTSSLDGDNNNTFTPAPLIPNKPSNCTYCLSTVFSSFETRNTYAQGRTGGVLSSTSKEFFAGDSIVTSSTNTYDSSIDYLLRKTETNNSKGELVTINQYYPKDFTSTTVYNRMVGENMLSIPVKVEKLVNNSKTATQETYYKEWYTGKFFPEFIKSSKGNQTSEDRIQIHSYYTDGNVKEASKKDGSKTVYIWGYENKYLIAKIENANYSSISSLVSNLQSLSNSDNDRTQGYTGNEGSLRQALDALRSNSSLVNSLVTTYTYDPLVGVTSITDPKGYVTYFEYDEFKRFVRSKDSDGKILSENQYNYKQ